MSSPFDTLEQKLGYRFKQVELCQTALTHKSWVNENRVPDRSDNERLEFLGDAVLALVVSDLLMKKHPQRPEGELSKVRVSEPPRLIATYPLSPRPNAMAFDPLSHLSPTAVPYTALRKPTMFSMPVCACVQVQPFWPQTGSTTSPFPASTGPWSLSPNS